MTRRLLWAAAGALSIVSLSLSAQSVQEIRYDAAADASTASRESTRQRVAVAAIAVAG